MPWFTPEEEPWALESRAERRLIESGENRVVVPEQFFYEILAVLCRKLESPEEVAACIRDLDGLILTRYPLNSELGLETARIAFRYRLSGYDACYVALAKLTGSLWLTADRRAHERVAVLGLSRLLGS